MVCLATPQTESATIMNPDLKPLAYTLFALIITATIICFLIAFA